MAANRILYFYLLVLSFFFFVLFDLYLFHLFFLFLLLLPPICLLAALPTRKNVRYWLETSDEIMPKGSCHIGLTAANRGLLPCACVRIHLSRRGMLGRVGDRFLEDTEETVHFPLGARQTYTLRPTVQMAYCGRMDFAIRRVEITDMLGLICLPVPQENGLNRAESVYVLPELQSRTVETEEAASLGLNSATYSTEKAGGDPAEIFQLRDYREGDSLHSVHRKLSSRMQRLIVREFGLPLNPSLHFLLELPEDAKPAAMEYMLGAALAFSEYLMSREIVHRISWLGEDGLLHTATVTGADTLASAMHELLALPGQTRWRTLEQFVLEATSQSEVHLIYLAAGAAQKPDAQAARLLESVIDLGVCCRLTLMPSRCTAETAQSLSALGCEVQLISGRVLHAEAEA